MKLYYIRRTRSGRPRWALEELGVPHELSRLEPKDTKTPEYRRDLHPLGHVPAFVDGDMTMFESGAIVAYLADKYLDKRLAPPPGETARGPYLQWMFFAMTEIEPLVADVHRHTRLLPEAERIPAVAESRRQRFAQVAEAITHALGERPYILGDEFSAADILVGGNLIWANAFGLLAGHPQLQAYIGRLTARPAYQRAAAD